MTYAVRAWRDGSGSHGITIGTVTAAGFENHVAEIELSEHEIDGFLAACVAARERARQAVNMLAESMPGAYETWPG